MRFDKKYNTDFSVRYSFGNFHISIFVQDEKNYGWSSMHSSSPSEVFEKIDKSIDFNRNEDAAYEVRISKRARKKLGKWADAIEGDVEAVNALNFSRNWIVGFKLPSQDKTEIYLRTPPTKEHPYPALVGYMEGEDNINITDDSVDAGLLFPNAKVVA